MQSFLLKSARAKTSGRLARRRGEGAARPERSLSLPATPAPSPPAQERPPPPPKGEPVKTARAPRHRAPAAHPCSGETMMERLVRRMGAVGELAALAVVA